MNWLVDFALHLEGLSDTERAQVEAAIPDMQAIVDLINTHQNIINKIMQHYKKAGPALSIILDKLK